MLHLNLAMLQGRQEVSPNRLKDSNILKCPRHFTEILEQVCLCNLIVFLMSSPRPLETLGNSSSCPSKERSAARGLPLGKPLGLEGSRLCSNQTSSSNEAGSKNKEKPLDKKGQEGNVLLTEKKYTWD